MKPTDHRAWFLVMPVVLCVAFSAILPLMTIVNYSVQDIISPDRRVFVGTEWFAAVLQDEELHGALFRQIGFSFAVLLIQIPLGILLALDPWLGLATLATWLVVAFAFRYSSLAALVAALFAPFYYGLLFGTTDGILLAVVAMAALLIYRHRKNIGNLLAGKESKIGSKKKAGK